MKVITAAVKNIYSNIDILNITDFWHKSRTIQQHKIQI